MGTPSVTSRGMKEKEMVLVAEFIHRLIDDRESSRAVRREVEKLCRKFPLPYR